MEGSAFKIIKCSPSRARYTSLWYYPSSLSLAPRIFRRCISAALSSLHLQGRFLFISTTGSSAPPHREGVAKGTGLTLNHVTTPGLTVNNEKRNFIPSQLVTFVMALNSCTMRACVTPQHVASILLLPQQLQFNKLVKVRTFQQQMGMLKVASMVTP